jgi:hypothetical protein
MLYKTLGGYYRNPKNRRTHSFSFLICCCMNLATMSSISLESVVWKLNSNYYTQCSEIILTRITSTTYVSETFFRLSAKRFVILMIFGSSLFFDSWLKFFTSGIAKFAFWLRK